MKEDLMKALHANGFKEFFSFLAHNPHKTTNKVRPLPEQLSNEMYSKIFSSYSAKNLKNVVDDVFPKGDYNSKEGILWFIDNLVNSEKPIFLFNKNFEIFQYPELTTPFIKYALYRNIPVCIITSEKAANPILVKNLPQNDNLYLFTVPVDPKDEFSFGADYGLSGKEAYAKDVDGNWHVWHDGYYMADRSRKNIESILKDEKHVLKQILPK